MFSKLPLSVPLQSLPLQVCYQLLIVLLIELLGVRWHRGQATQGVRGRLPGLTGIITDVSKPATDFLTCVFKHRGWIKAWVVVVEVHGSDPSVRENGRAVG